MTTQTSVAELRATIVALRLILSEGSLDEDLTSARRIPALKLTTDALGIIERLQAGKHAVEDAARGLACRIMHVDESGTPVRFDAVEHSLPALLRQLTASINDLAGAVVEAAVERAAPRVTACSRCDHMMGDRIKLLGEIEDLNMQLESLRDQATAYRCKCGGSRPPFVLTADLLSAADPRCACVESGVHGACVGHCPQSAERARRRKGGV